jgi:signal transduction histidine kinase
LSLEVDPAAMARAVRNLADNALIHGRGAIALGAELRDGGRTAVIAVIDEGELEDPDIGRHAFDRFFRGREATGRPGAGLGLALVQAVASDHGGAARLEPGPDGGSRASLVLPFTHH